MTALNKQSYRADGGDIGIGRLKEIADNAYSDEEKRWLAQRVLSLLDENLQLQRDKDSLEAAAIAMRDDMRDAREKLETAEKRIAELESNEIREDGNQFLVVRHPGKTPAIKHCSGDLEEFLRQLIEQDPLVTIDIITHRHYGVGGQWVQDGDEYLHMMTAAGIGVKGE